MDKCLPVFSIVIPSFNHGHLIGRALDSVFAQTYPNIEIIVVDNHSTDNTDDVLSAYAGLGILVLKVNNSGSIAYSRNQGVSAAHGDWIAFLDSDDWWIPEKLQTCADFLCSADLIYHPLILSRSSTRRPFTFWPCSWELKRPICSHLLKAGNPISTSSVILRRSVFDQIGGFDESPELIAAEDYDAWIRVSKITDRFHFIPEYLGFYQVCPSSASSKDMSLPMRAVYAIHAHHLSYIDRMVMDSNAAYAAGRFAFSANRPSVAFLELKKSFLYGRLELKIRSSLLLIGLLYKIPFSMFIRLRRAFRRCSW